MLHLKYKTHLSRQCMDTQVLQGESMKIKVCQLSMVIFILGQPQV